VLAVGAAIWWASWAKIDQITRTSGQAVVSSRNQVIQAPDGGVLEKIFVKEGDQVKRGQVLVRFDKTKTETSFLESKAKWAGLKATVARLQAETAGSGLVFPPELGEFADFKRNQTVLFHNRQTALNEEVSALLKSMQLLQEELDMNTPLLASGDVSRSDILRLQRQLVEIRAQMTNRKNKYLQDAQAELSKALEDLAGVEQVLAQRRDQLAITDIKAPMDGLVRNVRMTTRGGVARTGEEIMQIVPMEDDLIFEAKVRPLDIAFIKPGLTATVKLDAYDYSIYGTLSGEVTYISPDTLNEESRNTNEQAAYRVQIKTKERKFQGPKSERIEIQPGMTATIEIKTGSNTILRYLTKPVTKTISESMGER
jgi:adhesin transport system membrane fusion protein